MTMLNSNITLILDILIISFMEFPSGSDSKESTRNSGELDSVQGWKDSLEEVLATHSSILAWIIPMNRGAWQDTIHGVAKSQT